MKNVRVIVSPLGISIRWSEKNQLGIDTPKRIDNPSVKQIRKIVKNNKYVVKAHSPQIALQKGSKPPHDKNTLKELGYKVSYVGSSKNRGGEPGRNVNHIVTDVDIFQIEKI
jgi:hypothetical protein